MKCVREREIVENVLFYDIAVKKKNYMIQTLIKHSKLALNVFNYVYL